MANPTPTGKAVFTRELRTRHNQAATALGVATGNNRVSANGEALLAQKSRGSQFIQNVILPGQSLQVPANGTQFYVRVATGPIMIKPDSGTENEYEVGTGLQLDIVNQFSLLQITNNQATAIVFEIFVGFDVYIDKRFYLNSTITPQVVYPTSPVAATETTIDIPDISTLLFQDINGNEFYALQRTCVLISNVDTGVTLLIQAANATVSGGPAVGSVPPETTFRLDASGDFALTLGGAAVNAIVSEIYTALPKR